MKNIFSTFAILMLIVTTGFAQGFKVKASGEQTFSFHDNYGRNQTTFFSVAPLEDITGTASDVSGTVSFDVSDFASTLKGKIEVKTASLKSGIDLRDEHIRSADWLDAEKYPSIIFEIKKVKEVKQAADNKLSGLVEGHFTMKGITKPVIAKFELTYLDESEKTKMRAPGDLLGVRASFKVKLSDFGVEHMALGAKVAEEIEVGVNVVASNKF